MDEAEHDGSPTDTPHNIEPSYTSNPLSAHRGQTRDDVVDIFPNEDSIGARPPS